MITTIEAADILLKARMGLNRIKNLPPACCPQDQASAYQCQNELTHKLIENYGGQTIGYKTACTNESAQKLVNLDGPFYGPLLSAFVQMSPAELKTDDYFMRVVEPEFGFQMATDLPSKKTEYTKDEVSEAVGAILPAVEIVDSRYDDWTTVGALSLIADNACNAAWVYGKPNKNWTDFDLANHEVSLYVNGSLMRKGRGDAVMGHPLNPLVWLVNMLSRNGKGLKAGDFVTTGITTEVYLAKNGDQIVADFGSIGSVELSFS
jgi:2-keto-4-pentenoate hydratase